MLIIYLEEGCQVAVSCISPVLAMLRHYKKSLIPNFTTFLRAYQRWKQAWDYPVLWSSHQPFLYGAYKEDILVGTLGCISEAYAGLWVWGPGSDGCEVFEMIGVRFYRWYVQSPRVDGHNCTSMGLSRTSACLALVAQGAGVPVAASWCHTMVI